MIKCLIVDDEPLAHEVLAAHITKINDLQLVQRCKNALEAFSFLQKNSVDLIFLDIHMPKISGLELLRTLQHRPKVIITSAHREYALEGFELDVVDYILKPITFERFLKALAKVYKEVSGLPDVPSDHVAPSSTENQDFIFLKSERKMVKVLLHQITYIEGMKDYVIIHTQGTPIVTHHTITFLQEKLPEDRFVRIHRSYIVAVDKITAFTQLDVEIGPKEIPLGRNYKENALATLNQKSWLK